MSIYSIVLSCLAVILWWMSLFCLGYTVGYNKEKCFVQKLIVYFYLLGTGMFIAYKLTVHSPQPDLDLKYVVLLIILYFVSSLGSGYILGRSKQSKDKVAIFFEKDKEVGTVKRGGLNKVSAKLAMKLQNKIDKLIEDDKRKLEYIKDRIKKR